jgi:hypothetical protein
MKAMGETIRIEHSKDYTVISNVAIRDTRLSFKSRGLHHLLLSYPNGWQINIEHLSDQSDKDGKDAVASALKELEAVGYLIRTQIRAKGKIVGYESTIRELPLENPPQPKGRRSKKKQDSPQPENSDTAKPQPDFPDTAKPDRENPQLENPQPENPVLNKYVLDQLSNQEISIPPNPQGNSREEINIGNPNTQDPSPQISAPLITKAESSGKQINPHESNFSAARVNPTQQSGKIDPFYKTRPKAKDVMWAWLPEGEWVVDGGLNPDFWSWMATTWMSRFNTTIHEAKSNVISHFRNKPEQLILKWDEYSSQKLKKDSSTPLPKEICNWQQTQHFLVWEQYNNCKDLEDFYSLRTWNRAYLEYALEHLPNFDWSKHLTAIAA